MQQRLHQFANNTVLVHALCERIVTLARHCIDQRGYFSTILAGGTTPRPLYQQLRHLSTDWQRWHIYFSDERYLSAGHPERNDSMALEAWLDHVAIPSSQIHRVPEHDNVDAAAALYASVLAQAPGFDLALLGLGEDGHTASLFPGDTQAANSTALAIAVTHAPKAPQQRVTMSPKSLSMATAVWFIVTGSSKRQALDAWLAGAPLPAKTIKPRAGVDIFTDLAR
jgi:6-phosphogluconolactonase